MANHLTPKNEAEQSLNDQVLAAFRNATPFSPAAARFQAEMFHTDAARTRVQNRFNAPDPIAVVKARTETAPAQPKEDGLIFGSVQVVEVYVNGPHQDIRSNHPEAKGHVAIIGHLVPDNGLPQTLRGRQWVRIIAPLQTKLVDTNDSVDTDKIVQPPCLVRFSFSDTGRNDGKGHSIVLFGSGELMRVGSTKNGDAVVVTKAVENPVEGGRQRIGVRFGGKERNGWAPKQAPKV